MAALVLAIVLALAALVGIAVVLERRRKIPHETGEPIGAPGLEHPEPRIGAFSASSSGAGAATDTTPAEGPISHAD